jgi:hypothetical protein
VIKCRNSILLVYVLRTILAALHKSCIHRVQQVHEIHTECPNQPLYNRSIMRESYGGGDDLQQHPVDTLVV